MVYDITKISVKTFNMYCRIPLWQMSGAMCSVITKRTASYANLDESQEEPRVKRHKNEKYNMPLPEEIFVKIISKYVPDIRDKFVLRSVCRRFKWLIENKMECWPGQMDIVITEGLLRLGILVFNRFLYFTVD